MKATISKILSVVIAFTMLAPLFGVLPVMAAAEEPPVLELTEVSEDSIKLVESILYIVQLEDKPLATYNGGVAGLKATNIQSTGAAKLDVNAPASVKYLNYLSAKRTQFVLSAEKQLGHSLPVVYSYDTVFNGLALELSSIEVAEIAKLSGVLQVVPNYTREIQTDAGPTWIGAPSAWSAGYMGEGMVVGVIDTGVNPLNPAFLDIGEDGYDHLNSGVRFGVCDSTNADYDASYPCNDKLIGSYGMTVQNDPLDSDGHGSHTASTAVGNFVTATIAAPTVSITSTISGVAPHAYLITYRACDSRSCDGVALLASMDQAVRDNVDAINYSIGGGASAPWGDLDSMAYLNARAAGVFVATSAGNDGPAAATVGSPGNAPWLTTVANSTHDRQYVNALVDMTGAASAPSDINGQGMTAPYGPAPIVYAGNYTSGITETFGTYNITDTARMCLKPFVAGTFTDEIVLCDRGETARTEKAEFVAAGGAKGYVLVNMDAATDWLASDPFAIPGVHLKMADGIVVKAWLATGTGHTATILGATRDIDAAYADIMADSSSRGENLPLPSIIKPDVSAPGSVLWAAHGIGGAVEWAMIGGTSMASPHVAGAGTLLMEMHPDWTPAEIQSALTSTGYNQMLKEDGTTDADPFDMGGGRVDLSAAAMAGFVLDESISNYEDADPTLGGDPKTLNIASLANHKCLNECSWTRVLTSTMSESVDWTVTGADLSISVDPAAFTLPAGGTQMVTITVDSSALTVDEWAFGSVEFSPSVTSTVDAHFPVAIKPVKGVYPDDVVINTRRDAGSQMIEDLEAIEISALTLNVYGLIEPTIHSVNLEKDPTTDIDNGEMYDDLDQVMYVTMTLGADAHRLVAEIFETASPDLDMFVGFDANDDGLPSVAEEICRSAAGGPYERCDVNDKQMMGAGMYWIVVMSFEASSVGAADPVDLGVTVIDDSSMSPTNLDVTGPTAVPVGTLFDLNVIWDQAMDTDDVWYGLIGVGSSAATPNDTGFIPLTINRKVDPVSKSVVAVADNSGITATYTLQVQYNVRSKDISYNITDTLPAGMSYVAGSATASNGATVDVNGNELSWAFDTAVPERYYVMSTSDDSSCAMPYANSGAYTNLTAFGIMARDSITGNDLRVVVESEPISLYGEVYNEDLVLTDDGFVFFPPTTISAPWPEHTDLPNAASPNALLAMLWQDMEVVYDAASNAGVSVATLGESHLIEFDDLRPAGGDGSEHFDFEMFLSPSIDDAANSPEITFAYDNLVGAYVTSTVGIENGDGTQAEKFSYNNTVLHDGMAICYDWYLPLAPVVITYQATVDAPSVDASFVNSVENTISDPESKVMSTSATFAVVDSLLSLDNAVAPSADVYVGDTVTYTLVASNAYTMTPVSDVFITDTIPSDLTFGAWVSQPAGATLAGNDVLWSGTLTDSVTIQFTATVSDVVALDGSSVNVIASLTRGAFSLEDGASFTTLNLSNHIYLPLVLKAK